MLCLSPEVKSQEEEQIKLESFNSKAALIQVHLIAEFISSILENTVSSTKES
jgi:hypothetical protein